MHTYIYIPRQKRGGIFCRGGGGFWHNRGGGIFQILPCYIHQSLSLWQTKHLKVTFLKEGCQLPLRTTHWNEQFLFPSTSSFRKFPCSTWFLFALKKSHRNTTIIISLGFAYCVIFRGQCGGVGIKLVSWTYGCFHSPRNFNYYVL